MLSSLSGPSENSSYFFVVGDGDWTSSVAALIKHEFAPADGALMFIHKPFVYDALLIGVFLPAAFLTTYRMRPVIEGFVGTEMSTISITLYIYSFLIVVLSLRMLFLYARWVFPTVELTTSDRRQGFHKVLVLTFAGVCFTVFMTNLI